MSTLDFAIGVCVGAAYVRWFNPVTDFLAACLNWATGYGFKWPKGGKP